MAVTITPANPQGVYTKKWNVTATADADTTATIPHGFPSIPFDVTIIPLLAVAYTSVWTVTTVDATNIVLTKGTGAGSGNAGAQVQVTARLPHSISA